MGTKAAMLVNVLNKTSQSLTSVLFYYYFFNGVEVEDRRRAPLLVNTQGEASHSGYQIMQSLEARTPHLMIEVEFSLLSLYFTYLTQLA